MIQKNDIDFSTAINLVKDNVFSNICCNNIGKILSFNKDNQTVEVQLMQLKTLGQQTYLPTILVDVPLVVYGTPSAQVTLPDPTGTICIVVTLDRNKESFMETGEIYSPPTGRMHNITDSVAIVTFFDFAHSMNNYDEKALSIQHEQTINQILYKAAIRDYADSIKTKVASYDAEGQETANSTFDIFPDKVDTKVSAGSEIEMTENIELKTEAGAKIEMTENIEAKTDAGGKIEITNLINIQNQVQNLATLMQTFIAACENVVMLSGDTVLPQYKTTFEDLKTQFAELLV